MIQISLSILVILAGVYLLAKAKKEDLGTSVKVAGYAAIITSLLMIGISLCCCMSKCCSKASGCPIYTTASYDGCSGATSKCSKANKGCCKKSQKCNKGDKCCKKGDAKSCCKDKAAVCSKEAKKCTKSKKEEEVVTDK